MPKVQEKTAKDKIIIVHMHNIMFDIYTGRIAIIYMAVNNIMIFIASFLVLFILSIAIINKFI